MRKYVDIVIPASSGDVAIDLVLDSLVDQSQYISTVYLIVVKVPLCHLCVSLRNLYHLILLSRSLGYSSDYLDFFL